MAVNKAILVGNLGRDPELRYTESGQAVCNFTIATSERYKSKEGEQVEKTEWHRIVIWGKLAEIAAQYLTKGRQVYIEGKIQTREWEDKEGQKRFTTEINVRELQFIGNRGDADSGQQGSTPPASHGEPPF